MPIQFCKNVFIKKIDTCSTAAYQHLCWFEFYQAVDLMVDEIMSPLDQDGMKTATLREQMAIMPAKKEQRVNMESLHLFLHFDRDQLETQLKILATLHVTPTPASHFLF